MSGTLLPGEVHTGRFATDPNFLSEEAKLEHVSVSPPESVR